MESLEDDLIDTLVWYIRQADSKHEAFEYIKSHLLQSQIKVIGAVVEERKSKLIRVEDGKDALEQFGIQWLNKPIEDQISSLNETLEFLKKSL